MARRCSAGRRLGLMRRLRIERRREQVEEDGGWLLSIGMEKEGTFDVFFIYTVQLIFLFKKLEEVRSAGFGSVSRRGRTDVSLSAGFRKTNICEWLMSARRLRGADISGQKCF